ncbi:MAG: flagellar filament capping protein FliD [Treponema sp.]|nr:flagellar filament capping protein FliD [Treponema sp.]
MADGLSIPGVTDKYKTNDLVNSLMEVERKPLRREEAQLEKYQTQQNAWRDVNQKISSLKETTKNLYSFQNPFNSKLTESSNEDALTADADRSAEAGSFKINIIKEATSDRFLSGNIDRNMKIDAGKYIFGVGNKKIELNWKGGKISDFVQAINRRGENILKASLIGVTASKKSLLIEGLVTGSENKLVFEERALELAKNIDMVSDAPVETENLFASIEDFSAPISNEENLQKNMPGLSKNNVKLDNNTITVPARGGIEIPIPEDLNESGHQVLEFSFKVSETEDITSKIKDIAKGPSLPSPGYVEFQGLVITNEQSETSLESKETEPEEQLIPINDSNYIAIKNKDGTEIPLDTSAYAPDENGNMQISLSLNDYPDAESLIIRNRSTGKELTLSVPQSRDASKNQGYTPNHAISTAEDSVFKYEGITLHRSSNDVDDVIPNVTLHMHAATEKPVTIKINPDKDSAKEALINFVGTYNQVLAEINILTSNKPEVISELDYLTEEEREAAEKKLGMFQGDFTLTNGKASMQRTVANKYNTSENAEITMLNQIGISTNASSKGSGYNASQMRGYLEIDEKQLDAALESNLEDIKNLFGYDSDGDHVIDSGLGYLLDKQTNSWTQAGGLISTKIALLENQIKNSNSKISTLQAQLDEKEMELKYKYANMEGTLNSLESQKNSLNNFANQNQNK